MGIDIPSFFSTITPGQATLLAAFVALFGIAFVNPIITYFTGRSSRSLDKNLELRKSLEGKASTDELDQLIRFQLRRYTFRQISKYKYQKLFNWVMFGMRLIGVYAIHLAAQSLFSGFIPGGIFLLFSALLLFAFEIWLWRGKYRGILEKTKYIAKFSRGPCNEKTLLLEDRTLNSGKDRQIGYPAIFVYNKEHHKIYAYLKSKKISANRIYKKAIAKPDSLFLITYEYAWKIDADSAYKVTGDNLILDEARVQKSNSAIETVDEKPWVKIQPFWTKIIT